MREIKSKSVSVGVRPLANSRYEYAVLLLLMTSDKFVAAAPKVKL